MPARLECVSEPQQGESFPLRPDRGNIIGREVKCDICIRHMTVSRAHCVIRKAGQDWVVEDLGSTNGTYVNGERVAESVLHGEDLLGVGKVQFRVVAYADDYRDTVPLDARENE